MTKGLDNQKKKRLLKAIAAFVIAAAAFVFLFFAYEVNSFHTQSYKESEANLIKMIAARELGKFPSILIDEDYLTLESMSIYENEMTNLRPLAKLKNLKKIVFYINAGSEIDFRPLAKFDKLKTLEIRTPNFIEGYSFLKFPIIKKEHWYGQIFSFFKKLKPAKSGPRSFNPGKLRELKQLESLAIYGFVLDNIDALANLINLKSLTFDNYPVISMSNKIFGEIKFPEEPVDMSPLANLTKLQYLNITNLIAGDYGFLKKLTQLKELEVINNQIGDMNDLAGLTNLEYLDLSDIKVEDVSVLKKLTGLKSLKLRKSSLSEKEIAELKEALPELTIKK